MTTRVLRLPAPTDPAWQDAVAAAVADAVATLRAGQLVVVPTETVYGLAGRGLHDDDVRAIYAAKGRPADNPVILHVDSADAAAPLFAHPDDVAARRAQHLADALWPGPLTIVSTASELVPAVARAGLPKVAVRVPAHPFARALAAALQEPFAAPSANTSGRPSPTTADDALATLRDRVDLVVDAGPCTAGLESSVVDVTGAHPRLLRPGALSLAQLREVLPDLVVQPPGRAAHVDDASPGLRHRHYAPAIAAVRLANDAQLASVWRSDDAMVLRAATAAALTQAQGPRAGACFVLPDDAPGFGAGLFAALYRAERAAPTTLWLQEPPAPTSPDDDPWLAVRDRLLRAAA